MKCSEARPLLDLLCDGELETKDSALVLDHMKSCAECHSEWNSLEQLRSTFQDTKDKFPAPEGLMNRISEKLRNEERSRSRAFVKRHSWAVSLAGIAATLALIGFFVMPLMRDSDSTSPSIRTASVETLVEDLASDSGLERVADRNQLVEKVGYDLKYLRLPDWRLNGSAVYKSRTNSPIARFDFTRSGQSAEEHLSCYQAPEGMIRANASNWQNLDGKRVLFGNRGKYQFALWSQNGRDYLFVTALPQPQLEKIVRAA